MCQFLVQFGGNFSRTKILTDNHIRLVVIAHLSAKTVHKAALIKDGFADEVPAWPKPVHVC